MTTSESTIPDLVNEGTPDGTALSATDGGEDGTDNGVDEGPPDWNSLTTTDGRDGGGSDGFDEGTPGGTALIDEEILDGNALSTMDGRDNESTDGVTNISTNLTQHLHPRSAPSIGTLGRHQSHQLIRRSISLYGSTLKPQFGSIVLVMD